MNDDDKWWTNPTIREYSDGDLANIKLLWFLIGAGSAAAGGVFLSFFI